MRLTARDPSLRREPDLTTPRSLPLILLIALLIALAARTLSPPIPAQEDWLAAVTRAYTAASNAPLDEANSAASYDGKRTLAASARVAAVAEEASSPRQVYR